MSALPRFSDIDLLGYGERVIDLDSEIADRALDLRVAQQELNRAQISRFLIDQRRLGPAERMRAVEAWIKTDHRRATQLTVLRTAACSDALPDRVQGTGMSQGFHAVPKDGRRSPGGSAP